MSGTILIKYILFRCNFSIGRDMIAIICAIIRSDFMRRRIFVAINLPENIKKRLKVWRGKYDYLPVRWTKEASLHLTLVFIGYVSDEQMSEVCRFTRKAAAEFEPFSIDFRKIVLGPPSGLPRMIWLEGEENQKLLEFKSRLQDVLFEVNSGLLRKDTRPFKPHITLARIKMGQWREAQINPADVEIDFQARVEVDGIEAMESDLKFDGAEYATLESCPLGG